nr:MAG: hypothetical protein [uncultured archaeon]
MSKIKDEMNLNTNLPTPLEVKIFNLLTRSDQLNLDHIFGNLYPQCQKLRQNVKEALIKLEKKKFIETNLLENVFCCENIWRVKK